MDIRDTRRENLRQLVNEFGTKAGFGRHYNVDPTYISQILNGHRNLGEKAARKLEATMGLPKLALDNLPEKGSSEGLSSGQVNVVPGPNIHRSVPLISWIQAGGWSEIIDNFQPGEAEEWRETTARVGPHAFALRVEGDSMTAPSGVSIPEGSVVIIDPDAAYINGSIVVAKLVDTQEATLKKLIIDGPNRYLKPLNPAYSPIAINGNCRIIGVAKKVELDL
ncbi:LexA family transcriptional regulator [Microbulbifer sp. OS29]|uniref:LexA family transcriptional regulator n=1 Tax=Microbulbifer okhotskensis TaxID=2926617 RepID=A0A9X2EQW2_9GAMM|nr:LexA family transcriptional regulator [Microbulbifer okhotskensis]MCO1336799.1 LexA family transcriptional regulator [Microbulbifer okhotskensis]